MRPTCHPAALALLGVLLPTQQACRSGTPAADSPRMDDAGATTLTRLHGAPSLAMSCRPEIAVPVAPKIEGQNVRCVIDIGSRNVKLVVASMREGEPASFRNLRQCRTRLQLGDKSFDPETGRGRPLPAAEQQTLISIMTAYRRRCLEDGGQLVGAVATEWARRATNATEVLQQAGARTGIPSAAVSRDEEAHFGYLSGTRGQPGKLVLDFGSRSLQLSFWARDARGPEVVSVPLGIDEAGDRFFGGVEVERYGDGKAALAAALRSALRPTLVRARAALKRKALAPELVSLGENGDLALAVQGKLWPGQPPAAVDEAGYAAAVKAVTPKDDERHGRVTEVLDARQAAALTQTLQSNTSLFEALRSPRLRRVYGNKMLVFPALTALLQQELGLSQLVLVPQEMADGYLLGSLRRDR